MSTWADVIAEMRQLLGDNAENETQQQYTPTLLQLAYNRAQDHFAISHTADVKSVDFTATASGTTGTYTTPSDLVQVASVVSENDEYYVPLAPGHPEQDLAYVLKGKTMFFPSSAPVATLWYYAMWPHVSLDSDVVQIPAWAEWAVMNLAISYALTPQMINTANLRRFQTTREAGEPPDNPPRNQAEFHLAIYREATEKVMPQQRDTFRM